MPNTALETIAYVQIEPQHSWHEDAVIRGNASGLRELAKALLAAADADAATTDTVFASDGEGYEIEVRRIERPDDFPHPFYTIELDHKAKHDLERATANHSADLSAIAPTTDEVAARVSSAGVNFDKMKDHAKQLENALRAMLKEYEGVFDKVDSQGKPYQSEGAKRAERLAFQLISPMDSTTTKEKP